jgi:hypothetical protein
MQKWRQWENADQDAWQLALEREAVIRPLAEQGRLSPSLVQDATRQLRLSRSVLYDLSAALQTAAADFFASAMEERPCNQGYVLGINARRAAELFYTRLLPETRATFVGSFPAGSQARFSEQDLPAPLPHASALLHPKRKHWTSPFPTVGQSGI